MFFLTLIVIGTFFYSSDSVKNRYYNQIGNIYSIDGFKKYFKESHYGAHQNAAYRIFKDNILFGVGLKNFREESAVVFQIFRRSRSLSISAISRLV